MPVTTVQNVLVPGSGDGTTISDGDLGEAELDLEWSGAVARNANIIFIKCDVKDGGIFFSLQYAVDNDRIALHLRSFERITRIKCPGNLELLDVGAIDLIKTRIADAFRPAPIDGPITMAARRDVRSRRLGSMRKRSKNDQAEKNRSKA